MEVALNRAVSVSAMFLRMKNFSALSASLFENFISFDTTGLPLSPKNDLALEPRLCRAE